MKTSSLNKEDGYKLAWRGMISAEAGLRKSIWEEKVVFLLVMLCGGLLNQWSFWSVGQP